jgi:hypothetical protein
MVCAGLVRLLEWKYPGSGLIIVDGDTYEEKNKERQDFTKLATKQLSKQQSLLRSSRIQPLYLCQSGWSETTLVASQTKNHQR